MTHGRLRGLPPDWLPMVTWKLCSKGRAVINSEDPTKKIRSPLFKQQKKKALCRIKRSLTALLTLQNKKNAAYGRRHFHCPVAALALAGSCGDEWQIICVNH